MSEITSISDITQIHSLLRLAPPKHPLISLLDESEFRKPIPQISRPIPSELYSVSLKNGTECAISYGRRSYDFCEGSLLFLAPGQSFITSPPQENQERGEAYFPGWTLVFHPELIRNSFLAKEIERYSFFRYESSEALHLSQEERILLTGITGSIKEEYSKNLDRHSTGLITAQIDLLLKYADRFYGRQFITRSAENRDILIRFENFLKDYFKEDEGAVEMLSVKTCAKEMGYSTNYLSDLLRKETGKSTQEHISFYILEKAKNMLAGSDRPVYIIASALGFEYAHHFSYFFKRKAGISPTDYRKEHSVNAISP